MKETFRLNSEYIALCDLLKACNVCQSGGEAKHFIAEGNVQVDGAQELRKTCKIRAGQQVSGDGFHIQVEAV
ncbi:RNA-binding S4 domain-containing protein [Chromobacterium sphagni]|uniref:RNA-binding protein n=1 Tax=Chromobacterium sphagni TaxID=1903179 RepID=A0A1S1X4Y4_9NEIS|nr:RNA-binding S4 domain-containing protein [Chromobacterium sphagni]OHX14495.1 RNA-binding protein [Chromobacterium sphagni]OHX20575.1 RNA-binding protein [Chromobacterium sphagni]